MEEWDGRDVVKERGGESGDSGEGRQQRVEGRELQ